MSTDTTPADNRQLAGIFAALTARQQAPAEQADPTNGEDHVTAWLARTGDPAAEQPEQGDPQWAGPSLPHPTEATSEAEADELRQGWDDWHHGIEPNQEQIEA